MTPAKTCGQLIVGGFYGTSLPATFARALAAGERGGAIVFRRNLVDDVLAVTSLTKQIIEASQSSGEPPIVAVDQEGGRVARLGPPLLRLPPAARLGATDDEAFLERIGYVQGTEIAALGFTTALAPVLDVHTRPENPIIGDRAFGTEPERSAARALAFARGARNAGIFPCGKHYPGHGDTTQDSHVDLPVVDADRERLLRVEFAPFRAAARDGIESLMTAHVVYTSLDAKPATLSRIISTDILRGDLGFRGVLFSDDLEMQAVARDYPVGELAVESIRAGSDALLICEHEEKQVAAHEALVKEFERDATFRERCAEAAARVTTLKRAFPPRPAGAELASIVGGEASRELTRELRERGLLS